MFKRAVNFYRRTVNDKTASRLKVLAIGELWLKVFDKRLATQVPTIRTGHEQAEAVAILRNGLRRKSNQG